MFQLIENERKKNFIIYILLLFIIKENINK